MRIILIIILSLFISDSFSSTTTQRTTTRTTTPISSRVSYNLPKLCPNALWYPNGTEVLSPSTSLVTFFNIFISTNNIAYLTVERPIYSVVNYITESVVNWTLIIQYGSEPKGLFITTDRDIYTSETFGNPYTLSSFTSTDNIVLLDDTYQCIELFIDINDIVYCSIDGSHRVVRMSVKNRSSTWITVAGNSSAGSKSNQLSSPKGIFVTTTFYLYVADYGNNRIQKFKIGQPNGTTIVANQTAGGRSLKGPTGIILDADENLYIVDQGNSRIVQWGDNGLRCIAGCSGRNGSTLDQLYLPRSLSFDRSGNIFVVDYGNDRVQMFSLASNSCDHVTTSQPIPITTTKFYQTSINQRTTRVIPTITVRTSIAYSTDKKGILMTSMKDVHSTPLSTAPLQTTNLKTSLVVNTIAITTFETIAAVHTTAVPTLLTTSVQTTNFKTSLLTKTTTITTFETVAAVHTTNIRTLEITSAEYTTFKTTPILHTTKVTTLTNSFYSSIRPTSKLYDTTKSRTSTPSTNGIVKSIETSSIRNPLITTYYETSMMNIITAIQKIQPPIYFTPKICPDTQQIGENCDTSSTPCDMANPCQNMGICISNTTIPEGYICICQPGFNGTECEFDTRPCKSTTCWNNGTCSSSSNNRFLCLCSVGWEGRHCEKQINYCENVTCLNKGVCQPLLHDYQCGCLSGMYSGEHCEDTSTYVLIRQLISKSVSYIAIIFICSVIGFIVIMDVLKYGFNMDVSRHELQRLRRRRHFIRRRRIHVSNEPHLALRFLYVDKKQTIPPTTIERI